MGARALNALLGLWLFISALVWRETPAQRWTAWVIGVVVVTDALAGISGAKRGRYLNIASGGWLILSAILWPRAQVLVFWNDLLVGFAMVLFAVAATTNDLRSRRPADV